MSTTVGTAAWDEDVDPFRRVRAGPAEGWLTLVSIVLMTTALAWSIDDAGWVRGLDFLPLAGLAGVLVGFAGPKLGWGRWTTHLLGVAFAAIILPIIAGGIVLGDAVTGYGPAALAARYHEAAQVVVNVWNDLAIRGLPLTPEYGHYFIALGAIVWAAGQYASYAVFGHRRSLDPVIVVGLLLLGNMALTSKDQLHLIVLYSLASLALLARSHAFDEQATWLRRRIGDPSAVGGLYLRGGAIFISAAVIGSLFLTATASSAPLQGIWKGVPGSLVELSQWLQRYLPGGGSSRNPGIVVFAQDSHIVGSWTQNDSVAFVAQVPASETAHFKWRVGTYSVFDPRTNVWSWGSSTATIAYAARADLLANLPDDPTALQARREVRAVITPETLAPNYVVSPAAIRWIDQPSRAVTIGSGWFSTVEFDGADRYTVDALLPTVGDGPGQITANRLRVASRDYSVDIQRLYLAVPNGTVGTAAQAVLDQVLAKSPAKDPYDIALTMENYLLDSANFTYKANIQDEIAAQCGGLSSVECFARIRVGYCQYYATEMAMLLRLAGIPTRLVQGFLPGTRTPGGTETVRNSAAHAWVEVYFPDYGWIEFDPTGGGVGQPAAIPSGPPATATPRPSFNLVTDRPGDSGGDRPGQRSFVPGTPGPTGPTNTSSGPFIVIALLLLVGAVALASVAWRRGPRPIHPDRAWGSVARWAARFGLGPRPSQTVYEYAGTLGDAVPAVRPELATVARAKVEIAYGHRDLDPERMRAVADAHRRLRVGLLRLLFRRPRRSRGPRAR